LDASAGIIHDERLNLYYSQSMVLRVNRRDYGVVIGVVQITSRAELERLRRLRREIAHRLAVAAAKDPGRRELLRGETRKLSEYSEVVSLLKRIVRPEEREGLFSDDGEVVKFFAARSEDYIRDRRPLDIAWQILTNFRFVQGIRKQAGGILVKVRDAEIAGRPVTGVTVVGLEREVSLGDCLRVIGAAVRGYQRQHDRAFFTADGIIVIRIEVLNQDGEPLPRRLQTRLAERLRGILDERVPRELSPGLELLSRKIIPPMLDEERELGIPQVYVYPHRGNEFKVVMVTSGEDSLRIPEAIQELERVPELTCALPDPPSTCVGEIDGKAYEQQISIIDVWVNFDQFLSLNKELSEEEEVLLRIEQALQRAEGIGSRLRFFDKTTRQLRLNRWERIKESAAPLGLELPLARAVFHRLGDRRLMDPATSDEQILAELALAQEAYAAFMVSDRTGPVVRVRQPGGAALGRSGGVTLVAAATPAHLRYSPVALSLPGDVRIGAYSRVDRAGVSLFLFRMASCPRRGAPRALSAEQVSLVLTSLACWQGSSRE
jgi:hypothetical protein